MATVTFPPLRMFIYGEPGVGKTELAGSAQDVPELRNVLVADMDGGFTTLRSRGDIRDERITCTNDLEKLLWRFVHKDKSVADIRTLILDNVSEFQRADLSQISIDNAGKNGRIQDQNHIQDYQLNKNRMLRLLRMARNIPDINLIVTSWATKTFPKLPGTQQANKAAQPTIICPDLTEGIRSSMVGFVDDVFYLAIDQETDKRYLYTSYYGPVVAKTRAKIVASQLKTDGQPYLVDPTFTALYAAYQRAYSAQGDK